MTLYIPTILFSLFLAHTCSLTTVVDPYAVPMNCQPIEALPPPPGFELPPPDNGMLPFNISDLPPPLPDTPPPPRPSEFSVYNHQPPAQIIAESTISSQPTTNSNNRPPWENSTRTDTSKTNSKGSAPPPTLAKKGKKLNTNFLAQLDAKLGCQSQSDPVLPPSSRSHPAINSLMNNRSRDSPPRDGLLSQIHGGVQLRRTENVNDRSAPKF